MLFSPFPFLRANQQRPPPPFFSLFPCATVWSSFLLRQQCFIFPLGASFFPLSSSEDDQPEYFPARRALTLFFFSPSLFFIRNPAGSDHPFSPPSLLSSFFSRVGVSEPTSASPLFSRVMRDVLPLFSPHIQKLLFSPPPRSTGGGGGGPPDGLFFSD